MVRYTMSCTVSCPIRHRDAVLTSRAACWAWGPPNGPGAIPDAASGGVDMARLRPQAGGARGRGQGGRPPPVLPPPPRKTPTRLRRPDFKTAPGTSAHRDVTRHRSVNGDRPPLVGPGNITSAPSRLRLGRTPGWGGTEESSNQSAAAPQPGGGARAVRPLGSFPGFSPRVSPCPWSSSQSAHSVLVCLRSV